MTDASFRPSDLREAAPSLEPDDALVARLGALAVAGAGAGGRQARPPAARWQVGLVAAAVALVMIGAAWATGLHPDGSTRPAPPPATPPSSVTPTPSPTPAQTPTRSPTPADTERPSTLEPLAQPSSDPTASSPGAPPPRRADRPHRDRRDRDHDWRHGRPGWHDGAHHGWPSGRSDHGGGHWRR